jgi:uroporphyrinogen-III decarboxylase
MDKILRLNERLLPEVKRGGADFVFLGGPGSEMISPRYYENFIVPYSKIITDMAHSEGLLIYSHICSPIEPMLSLGYYNQMGIDLFETLSEEPVGNIKSMRDAFSKLDPDMCTRGNVGLDLLLNGTAEDVRLKSLDILQAAKDMDRKHILAASDYLFYGISAENVHAICDAVREFNG